MNGIQRWCRPLVWASMCFVTAVAAQTPVAAPTVAEVEKLLAVNGAQKALETAVNGVEAQVRAQVVMALLQQNGGKALSATQQQAVDKAIPGIGTVLRQELGWQRLKQPYISLYQSKLTAADVKRLTELYQDPAYVALMEKMQFINLQAPQLVAQRMPQIMLRIQPVLEDALRHATELK